MIIPGSSAPALVRTRLIPDELANADLKRSLPMHGLARNQA
ncbi:hypothetical protein ACFW1M_43125 [Streptomyces inhibens]